MNMGSILAPLTANTASASSSATGTASRASIPETSSAKNLSDVQLQFMRMMEAHDRVRARLLGSSHASSYPIGE